MKNSASASCVRWPRATRTPQPQLMVQSRRARARDCACSRSCRLRVRLGRAGGNGRRKCAFFFRYFKKGDNDRAIADFDEAIRLDPKSALAFCNRGNAKLKINNASGNQDIRKARELDASVCR